MDTRTEPHGTLPGVSPENRYYGISGKTRRKSLRLLFDDSFLR